MLRIKFNILIVKTLKLTIINLRYFYCKSYHNLIKVIENFHINIFHHWSIYNLIWRITWYFCIFKFIFETCVSLSMNRIVSYINKIKLRPINYRFCQIALLKFRHPFSVIPFFPLLILTYRDEVQQVEAIKIYSKFRIPCLL